jgi:hypothetical protein
MTKTLVERLREVRLDLAKYDDDCTLARAYGGPTMLPRHPIDDRRGRQIAADLHAAASRIEELERALKYYAMPQIYAERKSLAPAIMFERGEIARQALSEPSPDAPAKRIGAARYLEG